MEWSILKTYSIILMTKDDSIFPQLVTKMFWEKVALLAFLILSICMLSGNTLKVAYALKKYSSNPFKWNITNLTTTCFW